MPERSAWAAVVTVKSGMQFEGRVDRIGAFGESMFAAASGAEGTSKPIVIIDDGIRFTYVPHSQVAAFAEGAPTAVERIKVEQRVAEGARRIGGVGPIVGVTPFDEYGRRIFSMLGPRASRVNVIQGITEVTPTYIRVEGLQVPNGYAWDMRIATSSIDRETLSKILEGQINGKDPDARLRIVRLYIQAERYRDALVELLRVVTDFPDLAGLGEQSDRLRQLLAQQVLRDIELRRGAGQHDRVQFLLSNFPGEGIAGETQLKVRDMLAEYDKQKKQAEQVLKMLDAHIAGLPEAVTRDALRPFQEEIHRELNIQVLNRMADYLRLADDKDISDDQKIALAVSGWLLGSGSGKENLAVALSLMEVRSVVLEYLRSTREHEREACLEKIKSLEGGSPAYVLQILENMKPPLDAQAAETDVPGLLECKVPGMESQAEFRYFLQLPPEYNPHRRYPCVVTLGAAGTSPRLQIDWWAGTHSEQLKMRDGQAARYGFFVLAPEWQKPGQREYEFSAREHAAVLYSLRDACKRFSIDTDRVFLSGHSMGGNAAWDIGVSHPDLWAGVIPIVANAARYVNRYAENARNLPLYFVGGQMDGNWLQDTNNSAEFDRYLRRAGYDCTIVEYRGRGHEHYHDEIQRIFTWMSLPSRRRDFFPREFKVASMREWDNFFWWIELANLPSRSIVVPAAWPPERGTRAVETEARILQTGRISVTARSGALTVWLSPRMQAPDRPIEVAVNAKEIRTDMRPRLEVLLEDVRTRGDRQNPFWAKVVWPDRNK